ncbi:GOLPH3/VPS74 family protein [Streptomyces natalensis]|uniref:GOLPH3/VPS74 family protein n=1 Tax=Streptomyces natalensis TaxID=68242 RepID=UPI0005CADF14|nr:GPP34 family phosphoprotein [Streptomyces natalensis]
MTGADETAHGAGGAALTLPEELLLLALDPVRGRPISNAAYLRYGVAGAALAELEAAGRITVEHGDRVAVANPLPLGDPVLDGALAALPAPGKHRGSSVKAHRWVRSAARPVHELCLRRLEERGAVRREPHRALGLFPYDRFPAGPVDLIGPVRARFLAALEAHLPDPRTRLLAAHVAAVDLDTKLVPGGPFSAQRRDLKRLAKQEWSAHAAYQAVQMDKSTAAS